MPGVAREANKPTVDRHTDYIPVHSGQLTMTLAQQYAVLAIDLTDPESKSKTTTTLVAISAINALLQPLLDRVQTALDHPAGISDPTWQDAELADLQKLPIAKAEQAHLAPVLAAPGKALLLHLQSAAQEPPKKVPLQVQRDMAFSTACQDLSRRGLLGQLTGPCTLFPCFLHRYSPGPQHQRPAAEAGEGHGPRKDFFEAAAAELMLQRAGGAVLVELFIYISSSAYFWYNTSLARSAHLEEQYWLAGWLLGQMLHNRTSFPLVTSSVVTEKLILGSQFEANIDVLKRHDPVAAQSLLHTQKLPPSQFDALMELQNQPAGTSREDFVRQAVQQLLVWEVDWQCASLEQGFWSAISQDLLRSWQVSSADLQAIASGGGQVKHGSSRRLQEVFRVVLDPELRGQSSLLAECFWEVEDSWSPNVRQQFVRFVTGSTHMPHPGMELLRVELPYTAMGREDHRKMLGRLPQATVKPQAVLALTLHQLSA
eukprot:jgi/Astpho2/2113/Aster-x1040